MKPRKIKSPAKKSKISVKAAKKIVRDLRKKNVNEMTRKEFDALPWREDWSKSVGEFDCLVILPLRAMHDSGYRCMDFVAVKNGKPVCKLSGCSDVICIGGIGGSYLRKGDVVDWSIDCLPKSGLLQLFAHGAVLKDGGALSSFQIFAKKEI